MSAKAAEDYHAEYRAAHGTAAMWLDKLLGVLVTAHGASFLAVSTAIVGTAEKKRAFPEYGSTLLMIFGIGLLATGLLYRFLQSIALIEAQAALHGLELLHTPNTQDKMTCRLRLAAAYRFVVRLGVIATSALLAVGAWLANSALHRLF